jgi:hypothetical protein
MLDGERLANYEIVFWKQFEYNNRKRTETQKR